MTRRGALYPPWVPAKQTFAAYIDGLTDLVGVRAPDPAAVAAALDGEVAGELRRRVALDVRRSQGAFPTPRALARRLVADELRTRKTVYVDPALGCGDLLLAVAEQLPLRRSVGETLEAWGRRMVGRDLEAEFVRATRLRLALLAEHRLGQRGYLTESRLARLLPQIAIGDGREFRSTAAMTVLLNPPFGRVAVDDVRWAGGRVSAAATFAATVIENSARGVHIAAILPDVLRAGSNYAGWREHVAARFAVSTVETVGQFDPWTDIDVFLLRGRVARSRTDVAWWPAAPTTTQNIGDLFSVSVGAVVPHRDPLRGAYHPYLCAHDLPRAGDHRAGDIKRRSDRRLFEPPFVVVRRTSRPVGAGQRVTANLIRANSPVAVENHLIVLKPADGLVKSCRALIDVLTAETTTRWLDERIRCRHLTVGAVAAIPWPDA
jgi:hypothetical protein